jgi:hypothetical protein
MEKKGVGSLARNYIYFHVNLDSHEDPWRDLHPRLMIRQS